MSRSSPLHHPHYSIKMSLFLPLLLLLLTHHHTSAATPLACAPNDPRTPTFPFCRTNLPTETRIFDLVHRLTLQEKILMLVNNAAPVPRLGIRRNDWWSEALHGVAISPGVKFGGAYPGATSFPQVITTAASFNSSLWEAIGTAVSDEARAMYNGGAAGLTFWSPNVNIFRDPRWGRGQETPGEDPTVVAQYATSYVRGLQGDGKGGKLKVAACCKHYTAYDVDNWNGVDRFHFNALVSPQDLADTYNVPFEACVRQGRVASVMCSYNQVNGKPTCADTHLLRNTIRRDWRLEGYIVSDCDSVGVLYDNQHYTRTPEEAVADVLKAGLDLDCGPFLAIHTENAIKQGLIHESDVDAALTNNIRVQMRLGMYDGNQQPYGYLGPNDVCSPAHQELALQAARQGIVLLKNEGRALPLNTNRHRLVAVIGPNSDATATMIANYQGVPCRYTSPLQGISRYAKTVHQHGCNGVACPNNAQFETALKAARHSDATVLVMGLDQSIEAEFKDRANVLLPGHQQELITRVAMASKGPTILVLMCGGPVDVSFAKKNPRISAILWVGYPGQEGGAAIADVLFGAHNPGGKLPNTWYPQSYVSKVPMTNMNMRPNPSIGYPGRTYRFYKGTKVFRFGFGLSYTTFTHSLPITTPNKISIPLLSTTTTTTNSLETHSNTTTTSGVNVDHVDCENSTPLSLHVDVSNTGDMDGAHTVFVYGRSGGGSEKRLVAFEKVHVLAGSKERVRVDAHLCKHLSYVDEYGVRRIHVGEHKLHIGEIKHTVNVRLGS